MKNLIDIIYEKLKVGAKTKVNNHSNGLDDFSEYMENNSYGKPLLEIKNNKIQTGKFYISYNDNDSVLIYLFPLYITADNKHCLAISLTYEINKNDEDYCLLNYVIGTIDISNKLRINKLISSEKFQDFGENIDFEKYINIIKKLYNASKRMHPNDFLSKYEKIINETT